eukprot:4490103-Pleurochrysis_carterae.AAC.1
MKAIRERQRWNLCHRLAENCAGRRAHRTMTECAAPRAMSEHAWAISPHRCRRSSARSHSRLTESSASPCCRRR